MTGRRALAELLGTAALVAIGTGTIVGGVRFGLLSIPLLGLGWFLAVWLPVLATARVSGAHLNPAVTTALAVAGRFRWRDWPLYVGSQVAGAFLGSLAVWGLLGPSAHLGASVPAPGYLVALFPAEFGFTALLMVTVAVVVERGEGAWRWRLLLPALAVGAAAYLAGPFTGISLNPARSIAPAVLTGVFDDLWIYLLAQPLGAAAVALIWRWASAARVPVSAAVPVGSASD